MSDKIKFKELAKGNSRVDIQKLGELKKYHEKLAKAGISSKSNYRLSRPFEGKSGNIKTEKTRSSFPMPMINPTKVSGRS